MTTSKSPLRIWRILLAVLLVALCIAADQATKEVARSRLPKNKVLSFAGGMLKFDYSENKGAVFSFERLLPKKWRGDSVTIAAGLFLGIALLVLLLGVRMPCSALAGLSLLCGGGVSNLYDRIQSGAVVDFLIFGWRDFHTYIFNVADIAIVTGGSLLCLSVLVSLVRLAIRKSVATSRP